jgi:hypothetical protein
MMKAPLRGSRGFAGSLSFCVAILTMGLPMAAMAASPLVQWVNYLDLHPSDATTIVTPDIDDGITGGGLAITSTNTGDVDGENNNKTVFMALELPKQARVTGVRVCYKLSNPNSFIEQTRLTQLNNPPANFTVRLDDKTAMNSAAPKCDRTAVLKVPIKAENGALVLSLRTNFASMSDEIVIRGLGLLVR